MPRHPDETNPGAPLASRGFKAVRVGHARLVQLGAEKRDEVGRVLVLDRDRIVVGRSADAALVVYDQAASRHHIAIERSADGAFKIVDLGSRNGVLLNDDRLKGSAELRDGDRILIGAATLLRFSTGPAELDGLAPTLEPGRAPAWHFHLETRTVLWSEELGRMLNSEVLAGRRTELSVIHPDDRRRVDAALVRASTSGEAFEEELRVEVSPGAFRWVLLRGQVLRSPSGAPERITGTATDVDERKNREHELGRMALIFECLSDGVFLTDSTMKVVDLNSAAERMFALDRGAATGGNVFELIGAPSPTELESVAIAQMRASGRWTTELVITKTNRELPYEVVGFPLRRDDDVLGAAFLFRDLTERRQLQAQVAFYDRIASLGTMSAGIAHEINNPLTFVSNNLEHVIVKLADSATPDAADSLDALRDALEGTRRIAGIVRDLKAFSRDDVAPKPVPTNLKRALDVAFKMTNKVTSPRAKLVTTFPDEIPLALATESRLAQVFVNLLINAAQAIPDEKVATGEIRVTVSVEEQHVVIEVADNGTGMKPDVLRRVFDPFFTTKPLGVGTGLGLSICHGLVAGFGGELTVKSELGVGSTFSVRLGRAAHRPVETEASRGVALRRKARVLVVDDEPMILRALGRVLQPHEVVTRSSVDEALPDVTSGKFDIVLCDLMMPGRTGMELYDIVQRERPELLPRLVFVTGGAFTKAAREFLAAIPNPTVSKPIDTAELSRVIHERLQLGGRVKPPTLELTL